MRAPLDVFKARIADAFDAEYVIDILDISVEMILDAFEDRLIEKRNEFSELEDTDNNDEE